MRIYLDASPPIFVVEQVPIRAAIVEARILAPSAEPIVSTLTRLECLVKPMRDANSSLIQDFEDFFDQIVVETISLSDEILERATQIRVDYPFKTPDAIHLAVAVQASCDLFLTNDQQLTQFDEIPVEIVDP